MNKQITANKRQISTYFLKKNGYIIQTDRKYIASGKVYIGRERETFNLSVSYNENRASINIGSNNGTGQGISILITPCNYGGKRWWFACPITGEKCCILYFDNRDGKWKGRKAMNLTYLSQNESKHFRELKKCYRFLGDQKKIDILRYTHVKGKATKKYLRLLNGAEESFLDYSILS